MEKKPITPLAAGLIIGLALIILMLIFYFTGLAFQDRWYKWVPAIMYLVLLIVFISMWSNDKNHHVTFGKCFAFGFQATCITTLIAFVFSFLFIYLTPDYKEQMLRFMKEQSRQNPQATNEQIEQGMTWIADHFYLLIIGGGLFFNLLTGLIGSLSGAAIAKKKPFDPFTQINQIGESQP